MHNSAGAPRRTSEQARQLPSADRGASSGHGRRVWRPVLLLGGFVLLWWLMAGVSQASEGPGGGLESLTRAQSATSTVRAATTESRAEHRLGRVTQRATSPLRPVAAVAKEVTRSVTRIVPVEPVVSSSTDIVRGAVSDVRRTLVRPRKSPPAPTPQAEPKPAAEPESAVQQGKTSAPRRTASTARTSTVRTSTDNRRATSAPGTADTSVVTPAPPTERTTPTATLSASQSQRPLDLPTGTPTAPCVVPGTSVSISLTWALGTEATILRIPAGQTPRTQQRAPLPDGPFSAPGCSPD